MKRGLGCFVLVLPLLLQGCLLDIAPAREALDETWKARMLAGEYGSWFHGKKSASVGRDEIRSSPIGADRTRYGISLENESTLGGGAWSMDGGMVARVSRPGESAELFGKKVLRIHGPWYTVTHLDYSYEFFLVVRPTATGRGRLVKQWSFPREKLALRTAPGVLESLPPDYPPDVRKSLESEANKRFYIDGFLSFDEPSKTATVAITGLVRPFEERVDLSDELR
ncbi:MAG TPA: hypothetical protein VKG64_03085 [Methylomirabilota bacterium]|nr:hypothetical protein [Methylomirabilota bacterium]